MNTRDRENFLIHIMNNGFDRAAISFSKLINRTINIVHSQSILIRNENDFSYFSEEQGDLHVLITQVIGDVSGKSFLIFNRDESQEIFKTLNMSVANEELNEAFLLELDNIISASVIAELSNALEIEVYGDVPQLVKIHSHDLKQFINKEDSRDEPSSVIVCNATFQFDKHEKIHPQFIWKFNSKVFDLILAQNITTRI